MPMLNPASPLQRDDRRSSAIDREGGARRAPLASPNGIGPVRLLRHGCAAIGKKLGTIRPFRDAPGARELN